MVKSATEENKAKKWGWGVLGKGVTISNRGFKKGITERVTFEQKLEDMSEPGRYQGESIYRALTARAKALRWEWT